MVRNIISLVLLMVSVFLAFKHGWDTFHYKDNPGSMKMMNELGIAEAAVPFFGAAAILVGVLLLFPKTFFLGNVLNAILVVVIMALAAQARNLTMVMVEIPFLVMPLVMIGLKYPFNYKV